MSEGVSLSEYARLRGISKQAVHKAVNQGRLKDSVISRAKNKVLLDVAKADAEWKKNTTIAYGAEESGPQSTRGASAPVETGGRGPSYAESRAIREAYNARLAKLEYEEKQGKLIPVDKVKIEAFKIARTVRDAIMNIPERLSSELASETDPDKVYNALKEELQKALEELSRMNFDD